MKRLLAWLDNRTGYKDFLHEALYERVPGGARWRYVWGSTLVFTFVIQMITGIFLWTAYSPSAQTAWESVYFIQNEMTLGWLVRGTHHFAAQAMVVLLALHLIQVIIDGAYRAPREVNFWLGLVLMQIVLGLSLTGYLLPWDQKGYYATKVSTKIMGATPVVGPELQKLVQGGPEYGHHTLTRFFAMHAGILPAMLIGFLVLHLWVFRKHGITVPNLKHKPDTTFWPDQVLRDGIACLAVLAVVMGLAYFKGAELSAPANPAEPYSAARPEWYFLFLFQFLRFEWVEHLGLAFGAIYVPGILMFILVLMPFIGRTEKGHKFNVAFTSVMTLGIIVLTIWALVYDSYFDEGHTIAVKEAKRDAARIEELAGDPPAIPVTGAATLLKNDPFTQGPKLFAKHCASCHRYNGHDGTGRMVYDMLKVERDGEEKTEKHFAYPTAADLGNLGSRQWFRSLLLDYKNHFASFKHTQWYKARTTQVAELEADLKKAGDGDLEAVSKKIIKLGKQLHIANAGRVQKMKEAKRRLQGKRLRDVEAAIERVGINDELKAALEKRKKELKAAIKETDGEIDAAKKNALATPDELKVASADKSTVEKQLAKLKTLAATEFLNPDRSAMATWWGDEGDEESIKANGKILFAEKTINKKKVLANEESIKALIEYLVSLRGREKDKVDSKLVKQGKSVFEEGKLKTGTINSCTNCHDSPARKFRPSPDAYSAPDLTQLYGKAWLKDFINNPSRGQHYKQRNQMPGFHSRLNAHDLDMLVRWMLKDYVPTKISAHESKIRKLREGLKKRPDYPKKSE